MKKFLDSVGKTEIRNIIAVITVLGCFALLYLLQIKSIPLENKDVINIAIGFVFGGLLSSVAGYYFGGSKSEVDNKTKENKN